MKSAAKRARVCCALAPAHKAKAPAVSLALSLCEGPKGQMNQMWSSLVAQFKVSCSSARSLFL